LVVLGVPFRLRCRDHEGEEYRSEDGLKLTRYQDTGWGCHGTNGEMGVGDSPEEALRSYCQRTKAHWADGLRVTLRKLLAIQQLEQRMGENGP
jgi:hypothetical protein